MNVGVELSLLYYGVESVGSGPRSITQSLRSASNTHYL